MSATSMERLYHSDKKKVILYSWVVTVCTTWRNIKQGDISSTECTWRVLPVPRTYVNCSFQHNWPSDLHNGDSVCFLGRKNRLKIKQLRLIKGQYNEHVLHNRATNQISLHKIVENSCFSRYRDSPRARWFGVQSPVEDKIFSFLHIRPDGPRDPPSLLYNGYHGSFSWGKAAMAWRWLSTTL